MWTHVSQTKWMNTLAQYLARFNVPHIQFPARMARVGLTRSGDSHRGLSQRNRLNFDSQSECEIHEYTSGKRRSESR